MKQLGKPRVSAVAPRLVALIQVAYTSTSQTRPKGHSLYWKAQDVDLVVTVLDGDEIYNVFVKRIVRTLGDK